MGFRAVAEEAGPARPRIALGALLGVVALLLHSFTDFT